MSGVSRRLVLLGAAGMAVPFRGRVHDVRDYGAVGDGVAVDSPAINRAIDAAAGGTVYFPAGTYGCHSLRLKSDVKLYLSRGATILGLQGGYDDPGVGAGNTYQDFGHSHWQASLIHGENLSDIAILGPGRIDGRGLVPRMESTSPPGTGDKAIALRLCRNVEIRNVTIVGNSHIGILATGVDNAVIDDVTLDVLRDGINLDCCRDVRVTNVTANTFNDDGIAVKSSYALGFPRVTENVSITDCEVSGYDVGTLADGTFRRDNPASWDGDGPFGRVKLGTESNGGFRNITISDVAFRRCRGTSLDTVDGGVLEDVTIRNITMNEVTSAPLFLRLAARLSGPPGTSAGRLRRVSISDFEALDVDPRYACSITGIPGHPVEDVHLRDVRIRYRGGLSMVEAAAQPPHLISRFHALPGPREPYDVPERVDVPPEPSIFGVLPAYGFYVRHARNITMVKVDVGFAASDLRPAFVLEDVDNAVFTRCRADQVDGVPMFVRR
jgi:polygalacturonase